MFRTKSPSRFPSLPSRWKCIVVIAAGGVLACIFWTLPNWGEFWGNVSQFPALWQIPANRRIIVSLLIKILSPLLIMGILGIAAWLYALLEPSLSERMIESIHPEQERQDETREKEIYQGIDSFPSTSKPQRAMHSRGHTMPMQGASQPLRYNPETPLPPTVSLSEALKRYANVSSGSVSHAEEQQALPTEQPGSPMSKAATALTSLSSLEVPQPVAMGKEQNITSAPLISLRLLKDISVTINIPGGGHVVVPLTPNAKRVQLLAYIAWRRGELIDRDKILEHVFGWGLSDEEATEDKLSERFESHKKLLRKKIREVVVEHINKPAGKQVIDPELDPFVSDSGFWGLSDMCRVEDLEAIEASHKIIALARHDGKLVDEIPAFVKEACEQLLANYPGDFLASLLKKYPGEFRPWQGRSSWVRKPFTLYRDYYLDALWYSAEYEWSLGQRYAGAQGSEAGQKKLQEHYGRAAEFYQSYAMYACNHRFDAKATFGPHGEYGERVGMSERAIRRAVVIWGALGKTDTINQVWSAYYAQMKSISDRRWEPMRETKADVEAAKAQTNAHRFASQIAKELVSPQDHLDRFSATDIEE